MKSWIVFLQVFIVVLLLGFGHAGTAQGESSAGYMLPDDPAAAGAEVEKVHRALQPPAAWRTHAPVPEEVARAGPLGPAIAGAGWLGYSSNMQAMMISPLLLASFNLGGGEIILILALVVILVSAGKLPGSRRRSFSLWDNADDEAHEAGRSVGGIFGKRAAQPLTPDNQVAELYKPAAFQKEPESRRSQNSLRRFVKNLWRQVIRFLAKLRTRTQ